MCKWEDDKERQAAWEHLSKMTTRAYDKADEKVKWISTGLVVVTGWFLTHNTRSPFATVWGGLLTFTFGVYGALSVYAHNYGGRQSLLDAKDTAPEKVPIPDKDKFWDSHGLWLNWVGVLLLGIACTLILWQA